MKSNILKSKYRLLVLFDHSKVAYSALRNAVNLAKVIDAGIDIFSVKSPIEVVRYENQLAAMRDIVEVRAKSKKKLRKLVNTISEEENIPVIYHFTFGNVASEIKDHIDKTQPDVVAIGKRKSKLFNFVGDGVTSSLLKNYKGAILISGSEEMSISSNNVSVGYLDDIFTEDRNNIAGELRRQTDGPIKVFKINTSGNDSSQEEDISLQNEELNSTNTTIFEFDDALDFSNSASNYIEKSNVGLLCVNKNGPMTISNSLNAMSGQIQKTINKTKIPVLILEN